MMPAEPSPSSKRRPPGRGMRKVVVAELGKDPDGKTCPFHMGLRTYFHSVVEPQEKEIIETVDYLEESDFDFEEKGKSRCSWEKACIWCGVPLLIMGVVAVLIGQLVPPRDVIYRKGSVTYLDRKAITYNHRLEVCRLTGLAALCIAGLMILLSFLLAAYSCPPGTPTGQEYCPVLSSAEGIPLSRVLTTVQPPSTPVHSRR